MNIESYPGQNVLISYLKHNKPSYYGFLTNHHDIIFTSITTSNLKDLDNIWTVRFIREGKDLPGVISENSRCAKKIQRFWQDIIKKFKKENLVSAVTDKIPVTKDTSNAITNFCYSILHELENKSNIKPFYKCTEKSDNKVIRNSMDFFTIFTKLDNEEYTNINEFEIDMHLIFRNCYTHNDMDILTEQNINQQNRIQNDDANLFTDHMAKQF
ncbi:bromodomain-containing protein [Rhizophagus clarus]|uniref:Bromodomain-containing protein n=1 Tax=Rhizophagus clarus TaxID=94130 RepID=A0A8H3MAC7_9GLOM|nr:bromodomain-containing protein [Rhizophagus clarus]